MKRTLTALLLVVVGVAQVEAANPFTSLHTTEFRGVAPNSAPTSPDSVLIYTCTSHRISDPEYNPNVYGFGCNYTRLNSKEVDALIKALQGWQASPTVGVIFGKSYGGTPTALSE